MADSTNTQAQDQGTQPQATDNGSVTADTTAKLYATRAEAEANKPTDATKSHKIFEVSKAGTVVGYLWARGYDNALALTARNEGFSASLGQTKEVSKDVVAAKLAAFTDDELKALGLVRKPQKGTKGN